MDSRQLEHVEQLISTVYSPRSSPGSIKEAQDQLLSLQKSENGWVLAKHLLMSRDQNAQFLGAVTITINLNDDKYPLPSDLREDLLACLDTAVRDSRSLVARKLISTLCLLYFRIYDRWNTCIEDVQLYLPKSPELVLLFCQTIVEDYTQLHTNIPSLRAAIEALVPKVGTILEGMLRNGNDELKVQAIEAFLPWSHAFFHPMIPLLPFIIELLQSQDFDVLDSSAGVIADIYPVHSKSWPKSSKDQLFRTLLARTAVFDWEVVVPLGRLVIAVIQDNFEASSELVNYVLKLTDNNETVIDDELTNDVLEFWSSTVEEIVFSGMSSNFNPLIQQVISIYWKRIQIYDMSPSSWTEFSSFRRDFGDFLESAYQLLGVGLFEKFVQTLLDNIKHTTAPDGSRSYDKFNWIEVEASLYCLNALADIISGEERTFSAVRAVFASSVWSDLSHCGDLRVRQTAVSIIGSYSFFFESDDGRLYLEPALTYLFQSLAVLSLQLKASKSVERLCSSCRKHLVQQLPVFLEVYSSLRSNLQSVAHTRTVAAISYVIQALPSKEDQVRTAQELISLIETSSQEHLDLLKCVAAMAKALQIPDDTKLDESRRTDALIFYANDPLGLRLHLMQIINQFIDTTEVDVCETLCDIFKAGLCEKIANPFVFGSHATLSFIETKMARGPADCRPSVMSLANFFVSTELADKSLDHQIASSLLNLVTMDAHAESLKLMALVVTGMPSALSQHPHGDQLARFALDSIGVSDRFVLRAASEFWVKFISEPILEVALQKLGIDLVQALALQIAGEANRSDLEYCTDVLKKLMQKHQLLSGNLLKSAIVDAPASRNIKKLDEKARSNFVTQVILLRGSRKTNDLVKKFWLFARGIPEY